MRCLPVAVTLVLALVDSASAQPQVTSLHNSPSFQPADRVQPSISFRKLGDGFNKPYHPKMSEHVVSSNMNFYSTEKKGTAEDINTKYFYTPIKSDPLLDDAAAIVVVGNNGESDVNSLSVKYDLEESQVIEKETKFVVVFQHLFEIIQDVLNIMRQIYYPDPTSKSDGADTWPLLKSVFLRYLRVLKETDLLSELREVIPVDELEEAVEKEDGQLITKAIIQSLNPSLFSFVCRTVKDLVMPLAHFTDNLSVPQLREYMPSTPSIDITWPIRYTVRRGLGLVGYFFSRRELRNLWEEFRSYSPFTARSLEYVFPEEEEDEQSFNSVTTDFLDDNEEGRFLSNPYLLLAGFGTTVLASVVAYKVMDSTEDNETQKYRNKRSASDNSSPLMEGNANIASLVHIMEAVDPDSDTIDNIYRKIEEAKPSKSNVKKFDPLQKLISYSIK